MNSNQDEIRQIARDAHYVAVTRGNNPLAIGFGLIVIIAVAFIVLGRFVEFATRGF